MTQPDYVPVRPSDRVRPSGRLSLPGAWHQDRPGEVLDLTPPTGARFGTAGPDLGYGLKLAKRLQPRLLVLESEDVEDVVAGCFACGARRSATFGRAPVIHDFEWAYTLWGYLGPAPAELVAARVPAMRGAAHDYWQQRSVVDAVTDEAMVLTPAQVAARIGEWRSFLRL
ncbi:MAG: hypothetical protein ACYDEN_02465 [Acidimicrobiales bacterium]